MAHIERLKEIPQIHILAVDDHALFRRCMVEYLDGHDGFMVVGEASSASLALSMINNSRPDIVLIDLDLGGLDGFYLTESIISSYPHIAVVILTASESEENMRKALDIGAAGYLSKDIEPENLTLTLERIMHGEKIFPTTFLYKQAKAQIHDIYSTTQQQADNHITGREQQILQMVTNGLMDKQIAANLSISDSTVKNHIKNIRKKLGAANRIQASLIGVRMGIVNEQNLSPGNRLR